MKCHCCNTEYNKISKLNGILYTKTYKCPNCGHVYQDWGKSEEWVSKYYQTYRETHPLPDKKLRELWSGNICNFFVKSCDLNNKKILEIGAYDGRLISKIAKYFENCELHVNDIDVGAKEILEKNFSNVHICDFLDIDGKFDALIAIDVWEHFNDVSVFYKKVIEMSCEYLLLQVPVNRVINPDDVEFLPHYHNPSPDSFASFWSKDFDLISYGITTRGRSASGDILNGFSAHGPELLCVFKKRFNPVWSQKDSRFI
jgi:hypothetical protein